MESSSCTIQEQPVAILPYIRMPIEFLTEIAVVGYQVDVSW